MESETVRALALAAAFVVLGGAAIMIGRALLPLRRALARRHERACKQTGSFGEAVWA